MIRRLGERMAVLLAPGLVSRIRRLTRRHLRCRTGPCHTAGFQGADIGRHGQLLEQKAEERNQRNPATVAATKQHEPVFAWGLSDEREQVDKLTLPTGNLHTKPQSAAVFFRKRRLRTLPRGAARDNDARGLRGACLRADDQRALADDAYRSWPAIAPVAKNDALDGLPASPESIETDNSGNVRTRPRIRRD
jgi:hypothetical protein